MVTKLLWNLIRVMPVVLGTTLMTMMSAHASERVKVQHPTQLSTFVEVEDGDRPENSQSKENQIEFSTVTLPDLKPHLPNDGQISQVNTATTANELIADELPETKQEPPDLTDELTESPDALTIDELADESPESTESSDELSADASTIDQSDSLSQETEPSPSLRWRFTVEPYIFIPLDVEGDVTIGDFTTDIDRNSSLPEFVDTARDTLNFGFLGRFEAWRGNLGLILDTSYINVERNNTRSPDILDGEILPSEIDTAITVRYGQFDLGGGYRFAGGNPAEAATEFDLGPVVFDVIAGMRIYTSSQKIEISNNLGRDRELDNSTTFVTPLLSSRLRWNLSRKVALGARGDVAGFGVSGLDLAWSVTGGVDWMFSGNTSVLLGYRVSSIDYTREVRDEDLGLDLLLHGPYLGVLFRF